MVSLTLFKVENQIFAYPTEKVKETIKIDRVFPVPLSPSFIKGVINLRNQVIPLVDTGILLKNIPLESDTAIILEINLGSVALLVSKVLEITEVEEEHIKSKEELEVSEIKEELINGFFERNGEVIFLLNLENVIRKEEKTFQRRKTQKKTEEIRSEQKEERRKGFVIFPIGKEWFAFPVEDVREIINYPENIAPVPQAPEFIEGVFVLRGEEIALISLRKLLNVSSDKEERRVIIVHIGRHVVGIAVDDVKEIKWIDESSILSLERDSSKGVIVLDEGKRLVLILDTKELLSREELEVMEKEEKEIEEEVRDMRHFVRFSIKNIDMVFPIEKVKEVIEVENLTPLPSSPDYVKGMYNLRNSVIVIIDLAKKLGIEEKESSSKVIVMENVPVGFIVSKLKGIMKVEEENIQPAEGLTGVEENVLEGIIKENGNIVFILDVDKVIHEEDIKLIKEEALKEAEGER